MSEVQKTEFEIMQAKADAEFAMTPVGQTIRQFEATQRMASMFSKSSIVPQNFRGSENIGNCVIAIDMAMRMNANPLMVMQNLYVVHGNPSFSSKFLIATINASKRYSTLQYEWKGAENTDDWSCRVVAYDVTDKDRKYPLYGTWISLKMAKDEGWSTKAGSKWRTMPSQMLMYRASAFWQRAYCPEISMGFLSTEELHDIEDVKFEEIRGNSDVVITQSEKPKEEIKL